MLPRWIPALAIPLLAFSGAVRQYVIELKSDPERASREEIAEEQRAVGRELEKLGVEVVDRTVTTSNTLLVRMDDDLVKKVQAIPGVKRARPARTFQRR